MRLPANSLSGMLHETTLRTGGTWFRSCHGMTSWHARLASSWKNPLSRRARIGFSFFCLLLSRTPCAALIITTNGFSARCGRIAGFRLTTRSGLSARPPTPHWHNCPTCSTRFKPTLAAPRSHPRSCCVPCCCRTRIPPDRLSRYNRFRTLFDLPKLSGKRPPRDAVYREIVGLTEIYDRHAPALPGAIAPQQTPPASSTNPAP